MSCQEFDRIVEEPYSCGHRNGRVDVLGDATQLGAFRTIAKPFALREMLQAVEQLLQESQGFSQPNP